MKRATDYLVQDHVRLANLLRIARVDGPTSAAGAPSFAARLAQTQGVRPSSVRAAADGVSRRWRDGCVPACA